MHRVIPRLYSIHLISSGNYGVSVTYAHPCCMKVTSQQIDDVTYTYMCITQHVRIHNGIRLHTQWCTSVTALGVADCKGIVRHIYMRV